MTTTEQRAEKDRACPLCCDPYGAHMAGTTHSLSPGCKVYGHIHSQAAEAMVCGAPDCDQPGILLIANDAPLTSPDYAEAWVCRWHRSNPSAALYYNHSTRDCPCSDCTAERMTYCALMRAGHGINHHVPSCPANRAEVAQ